jgi:hypothetical protein
MQLDQHDEYRYQRHEGYEQQRDLEVCVNIFRLVAFNYYDEPVPQDSAEV